MAATMSFARNVFLNFPFDKDYTGLRNAIVFAVFDCGFVPRCTLELCNSGMLRMENIKMLIALSRLGIHDISRIQLDQLNQLPRFNMPLELGIFIGAASFGDRRQRTKSCLILDCEPYRYQCYMSDIAGQDIRAHGDRQEQAIIEVRNWLGNVAPASRLPGGQFMVGRFASFQEELPGMCESVRIEPTEMEYRDYLNFVAEWIALNPLPVH